MKNPVRNNSCGLLPNPRRYGIILRNRQFGTVGCKRKCGDCGQVGLGDARHSRMVVPTRFLKTVFIVAISVVSDWVVGILNGQFDHNMVSVV